MMDKTKLLLPFEIEYLFKGLWHPYGRYATLEESRKSKARAITRDTESDVRFEYRIVESKVIE